MARRQAPVVGASTDRIDALDCPGHPAAREAADMNLEPKLRDASDALLANLDRLRDLEEQKRQLPLDSPRLVELATEIESLARTVLHASDRQTSLAEAANAMAEAGVPSREASIEAVRPARDVHAVLADWRDAERRLAGLDPASADAADTRSQIAALREEYRRAHDAAAQRSTMLD